jgi:predicted nucleic acid-binding protein
MPRDRIVIDNNSLISCLLLPAYVPGRAVRTAVDTAHLLVSESTLSELADVLSRPKFDPHISIKERQNSPAPGPRRRSRPITYRIQACRDPKDDMFLELGHEQ